MNVNEDIKFYYDENDIKDIKIILEDSTEEDIDSFITLCINSAVSNSDAEIEKIENGIIIRSESGKGEKLLKEIFCTIYLLEKFLDKTNMESIKTFEDLDFDIIKEDALRIKDFGIPEILEELKAVVKND